MKIIITANKFYPELDYIYFLSCTILYFRNEPSTVLFWLLIIRVIRKLASYFRSVLTMQADLSPQWQNYLTEWYKANQTCLLIFVFIFQYLIWTKIIFYGEHPGNTWSCIWGKYYSWLSSVAVLS